MSKEVYAYRGASDNCLGLTFASPFCLPEALNGDKEKPVLVGRVISQVVFEFIANVGAPAPAGLKTVYVIQCPETLRVKIGITDDFDKRIKEIQAMSPTVLELIHIYQTIGCELEAHLHKLFEPERLHGEWFEYSEEMERRLDALDEWHDSIKDCWMTQENSK